MSKNLQHLAATGVAALSILATAVPANAATTPAGSDFGTMRGTCAELENAIGCFESSGDHVYVHDDAADGKRPSVQWRTSYGRSGQCTWDGTDYWTDCNYNMREDSWIEFRLLQHEVGGNQVWATGWVAADIGG